jgi:hypothetical protein
LQEDALGQEQRQTMTDTLTNAATDNIMMIADPPTTTNMKSKDKENINNMTTDPANDEEGYTKEKWKLLQ